MVFVVPNDEIFKKSFETASVQRTNLARYYLRAIDLLQKGESKPQFVPNPDVTAVNAEHIMPVNPDPSEWNITQEEASVYYKRLGNIVLLGSQDNSRIGNKSFEVKKQIFSESPYIATQWVAQKSKWGEEEIIERQIKLAEIAPKVWPIKL